ncbi:PepSY-associated TM helix domain-containing protein [Pseudomaricurvus sp.]|uniref:PepSY-associated TM helix domain-containing protein n=1 Tax=Pseudomaricurvus sp. TaxID=2004510 RepID=UPI003F6CF571
MSVRFMPSKWHLGTVRQWHWISSAVCLIGMLLFAITGITLNHADIIPAAISTEEINAELPQDLVQSFAVPENERSPLPNELRVWLSHNLSLHIPASVRGEWMDDEVYVALPRPGGDAWMSLDLETGDLLYEKTTRGWVAYLNDLHKGRDTGTAWRWFIDVFAVGCIVFCASGLLLLYRHTGQRPTTWPVVGLGLVIPVLLIILFVH